MVGCTAGPGLLFYILGIYAYIRWQSRILLWAGGYLCFISVGRDCFTGQQHLHSFLGLHRPRKRYCRCGAKEFDLNTGRRKLSVLTGDHQIAAGHKLTASGRGQSVHLGDHRLGQLADGCITSLTHRWPRGRSWPRHHGRGPTRGTGRHNLPAPRLWRAENLGNRGRYQSPSRL